MKLLSKTPELNLVSAANAECYPWQSNEAFFYLEESLG